MPVAPGNIIPELECNGQAVSRNTFVRDGGDDRGNIGPQRQILIEAEQSDKYLGNNTFFLSPGSLVGVDLRRFTSQIDAKDLRNCSCSCLGRTTTGRRQDEDCGNNDCQQGVKNCFSFHKPSLFLFAVFEFPDEITNLSGGVDEFRSLKKHNAGQEDCASHIRYDLS